MNFALGIATVILCTIIQCAFISGLKTILLRKINLGRHVGSFWRLTLLLSGVTAVLFVAMMVQVLLWAAVLFSTDQIETLQTAFYFSMVNFTSLGYGDITLSSEYAILGPMEAANGILMLGLSTSVLFSVLRELRPPAD